MRIWHKDLIPVLPRQQLLGQWWECCLIAKQIAETGIQNHMLTNRVMEYPRSHFYTYCINIAAEMEKRGYRADIDKLKKWCEPTICFSSLDRVFDRWHNDRYLRQCLHNLQEKYDCGAISDDEWTRIIEVYSEWK